MRLRFSLFVKYDLAEISEYISQDSPRQAANFIRLLRQRMTEVAKHPLAYRIRPELGPDARMLPVGSYVILFRVFRDFVRIERVVHGARELLPLLEEMKD